MPQAWKDEAVEPKPAQHRTQVRPDPKPVAADEGRAVARHRVMVGWVVDLETLPEVLPL